MAQSKIQKLLAEDRQRRLKRLKQRDKKLAEKKAKDTAKEEAAALRRKNLRKTQGNLKGQQAAVEMSRTEGKTGSPAGAGTPSVPPSKKAEDRLATLTVAGLTTLPVGKALHGVVKVGQKLWQVGSKTYKTAAAARNAKIAQGKTPPVRSSKTTPSAATKAKNRLTSTPNTSTPPPPVRQSRTPSSAMDAQRAKAAKDAAAKKRREDAAKKIAEKKRLQKAAAERKAMEAKRQKAVSQSQTAMEAAQRSRRTPNTSTARPPVSQTRTSSSVMDAERTKVARQQKDLPKNRKSFVTKLSTPPASKTGNVVKAAASQTVKAAPQSIQKAAEAARIKAEKAAEAAKIKAKKAAEAARIKAKKGAEAAKVVAPQISKTAKTVGKSGTQSAAKAATALAVVNKEPKNGKSEIKGKMSSVKKVPKKGKAPKSKGVDTDDFSDEREAYTSLYNKNGKSRQSATRKSEEDKHWREIKKISKALGLKYMVPKLDEHGMPTDPDMLEAEVTSDAKGGLIGRPRKTTKVKIKKKAASKPKRKTSSTRKRKGFGGRGQGAALRGF